MVGMTRRDAGAGAPQRRPDSHTDPAPTAARRSAVQSTGRTDIPRCRRCRRPLVTALARAARLGPTCAQTVIAYGRAPDRPAAEPGAQDPLPGLAVAEVRHG